MSNSRQKMKFNLTHTKINNDCYGFLRQGILGMLPLHLAVLYGFPDCCRKLLCNGENLFVTSGCTSQFILTHLSTDTTQTLTIGCLFLYPSGQFYSILPSPSSGQMPSFGFDINTPDDDGRTCLHAAATGG